MNKDLLLLLIIAGSLTFGIALGSELFQRLKKTRKHLGQTIAVMAILDTTLIVFLSIKCFCWIDHFTHLGGQANPHSNMFGYGLLVCIMLIMGQVGGYFGKRQLGEE